MVESGMPGKSCGQKRAQVAGYVLAVTWLAHNTALHPSAIFLCTNNKPFMEFSWRKKKETIFFFLVLSYICLLMASSGGGTTKLKVGRQACVRVRACLIAAVWGEGVMVSAGARA
jgi:hypothetical protein